MFISNTWLKTFCWQWLPEVWNSWTSPDAGFPPFYCSARPLLQWFSVAVGPFCLDQVTDLSIFHFFASINSWVALAVCFGSLSIPVMKLHPISLAGFGWIWADSMSLNTSQFIRLLLSCVTSSINTSDAEPLAAMHAPAITLPPLCFTDDVVCFRLWAVPRLHHAFYHHPGRSWSWFHLSKESSTRTELVFFKICFSKVQSSLSIHEAYEWTVQWTFCIYFHAVFSL